MTTIVDGIMHSEFLLHHFTWYPTSKILVGSYLSLFGLKSNQFVAGEIIIHGKTRSVVFKACSNTNRRQEHGMLWRVYDRNNEYGPSINNIQMWYYPNGVWVPTVDPSTI